MAVAMADLMTPHMEVVIHDLRSGTIAHIVGNLSGRKVGDPSHVEREDIREETYGPHIRIDEKGRRIKSTTAVIRDGGEAVGLFCTNLDLTPFDAVGAIGAASEQLPEDLFRIDWAEKVRLYLRERGVRPDALQAEERHALIEDLHRQGAFEAKHAAGTIAGMLGISRATLYKHLGRIR